MSEQAFLGLHSFYGVDGNTFKLDDKVWRTVEDESDGYRSYLEGLEPVLDPAGLIFFSEPLAQVQVQQTEENDDFDGYIVTDTLDGHVWLRIGTDHTDFYYPFIVFEYSPKEAGGE